MNSIVKNFLNPVKIGKAIAFHIKQKKYKRTSSDLELMLYSRILKSDMLHLGYFEDVETEPEDISINDIEKAQIKYCDLITGKVVNKNEPVLDVGCGMGGLASILRQHGFRVEVLTPNDKQIDYIKNKYQDLPCYKIKYEDLDGVKKYGTVINSESLRYIDLDKAFLKTESILSSGGQWIICDFFCINNDTVNETGHTWDRFLSKIKEHKMEIVSQQDITRNILPVLKLLNLYVTRFANPLIDYAQNKLLAKKAWLYYLTNDFRASIDKKILKETTSIDPEKFINGKKYMLVVLKKN